MLRHALALVLLVTPALAMAEEDADAGASGRSAMPIAAAKEGAYPGTMLLNIDATDLDRAIFRVTQTIPITQGGAMTLLSWYCGSIQLLSRSCCISCWISPEIGRKG